MKRIIVLFLLVLCYGNILAAQSGSCGRNLRWSYNSYNSSLTITGYGNMDDYKYDYSKGSYNMPWEPYRKSITQIFLPNGITNIGDHAFCGCIYLSSIVIPESVNVIGKSAFDYCIHLQSITIPRSVTTIKNSAFQSCERLKTVIINNSSTTIGEYAFFGCKNLTSIKDNKGHEIKNASKNTLYTSSSRQANTTNVSGISNTMTLSSAPPNLVLVSQSVEFIDNTKNNQIDANENCSIRFKVQNIGKGKAYNCVATIKMKGNSSGISAKDISITNIAVGEIKDINIPITSNLQTTNGDVIFTIEVKEPNGFGTDPFELSIKTLAYEQPYIQIVDYVVTGGGTLIKKQPFNLQLMLQNTKYGVGENVEVKLELPTNVFLLEGSEKTLFTRLEGGKAKSIDYQLIVNNNYSNSSIPIKVCVNEKYKKYAEDKTVVLQLNQNLSSNRLTVKAAEEELIRQEIKLASLGSDVDRNIPKSSIQNKNTFVLIIANENYQTVATVPFALNDGRVFRQYCEQTLGIPSINIRMQVNSTGNQIKSQINWLRKVVETFDKPQIIVYYAGHGIPDESSRTAYLLPVDGIISDMSTCYKLDDLYTTLGALPTSQITVFMDACFSGSKRENGMLASARGVALKAKSGVPQGNMVVFSAAQGDETAYPNREQQHGLFTYYLLKKLQETQGDIALKDLGDYITKQVSQQSLLINDKKQTPCVIPSASLGTEWQSWKLK